MEIKSKSPDIPQPKSEVTLPSNSGSKTNDISVVDNLKSFIQGSQPKEAEPGLSQPKSEINPASGSGLSDSDFLNTGKHTISQPFNMGDTSKGTPGANTGFGTAPSNIKSIGQIVPNSGKFAVILIHEMAIPALTIWVSKNVGYKCDKAGLKLTKEDKEVLIPAWEGWLNSLNINIEKPIYQLLLALGFVYGSKWMDGTLKFEKVKKTDIKKPEPVNSENTHMAIGDDTKVTEENYQTVFEVERENLIDKVRKERRRGRKDAMDFLQKNAQFKLLDKNLRLKYGLKKV